MAQRKMASVQKIERIEPHPNADRLEIAKVLGWNVITKKGEFTPSDPCIYCEIDSLMPPKPEFDFLKDRKYRIRTIKLRGILSQGLCLPMGLLPESNYSIGEDVSEVLGITKYEKPIPLTLRGRIRGNFPNLIPKTDEIRIQSIPNVLQRHKGKTFRITEKIDGTSMSCFLDPETGIHVCSRNLDLANDFEHKWNGNAYWKYATEHNLEEILKQMGGTIAIQGELFGGGIQGSKYGINDLVYRVFNFYDIANHKYLEYDVMLDAVEAFGLGKNFLVPDLGTITLDHSVEDLLDMANGTSTLADVAREGIVLRSIPEDTDFEVGRLSFKAVSNDYLLKNKE